MGGKPAYVYYISPGQLNVLAPDVPAGPVTVTVTTPGGTSTSFATTASLYGPAFFLWPGSQVVATRQDYTYAVKAGTFAGATTVAAKPGEVLILWGTGFGPTMPAAPIGRIGAGQRRLFDGIRANRDDQQHAGDCLWRGARARLGRLVPDRDPGPHYARRWRLAHSGEHRRRLVAHGDCSFGSALIRETMTLQRAAFYPLALLLIHASLSFGQPTIKLIAGGNGLAPLGDGGPAVNAFIGQAGNITVDPAGNLYIWDATDSRVRKVNTAGIISSVTATIGQLKEIGRTGGLATDSAGNLYIGDTQSYVVRKVDTSGVMTTIAGNGTAGISGTNGNGSQATSVPICSPSGVAADRAGNVYFGSSICGTVRKVDASGVLSTFAGGSTSTAASGAPWARCDGQFRQPVRLRRRASARASTR